MKGANERLLFEVLNDTYPRQWVSEYPGITGRKFRFDCANPSLKVAIEIEGGIWMGKNAGHTSGMGYLHNMEKYNLATVEGWRVLRYAPDTLRKAPWKIIRDVRTLCGASSNEAGQTVLNLDNVKSVKTQLQVKLGV